MTAGEQLAEQLVEAISPYEDSENWEGQVLEAKKWDSTIQHDSTNPKRNWNWINWIWSETGILPAQSHKAGFQQKKRMKGSSKMTVCTARNNPGVVEVYRFSRNIICMLIMLYSSQQFHNTFALLAGRVFPSSSCPDVRRTSGATCNRLCSLDPVDPRGRTAIQKWCGSVWKILKVGSHRVPKTKAIKSHWQIIILMIFIYFYHLRLHRSKVLMWQKGQLVIYYESTAWKMLESFNWWVPSISTDFYSIHVPFFGIDLNDEGWNCHLICCAWDICSRGFPPWE